MDEHDFEGTMVLEKLAEIGLVDAFFAAVDSDDFDEARSLMRRARIDSESITMVLKMMRDPDANSAAVVYSKTHGVENKIGNLGSQMQKKLFAAIQLRKEKKLDQALELLTEILEASPEDPDVNYQMAWTYDLMGKESNAAPFYEKALANHLSGEDRKGAMLGLGSTYRCLGQYQKSLVVLDRAVSEFPEDRSLKIFRALTLYNLGRSEEAMGQVLIQLLDTTSDPSIKLYEGAIRFYSDKLSETWK